MLSFIPTTSKCPSKSSESWPCAFKELWFHEMPFILLPDINNEFAAVMERFSKMAHWPVGPTLFDMLWSSFCVELAIRIHDIQTNLICAPVRPPTATSPQSRIANIATPSQCQRELRPNLVSLPVELRFKIFDYATRDLTLSVVGYRQEARDAFYFKQRNPCEIAMTCKQFYQEVLDIYFNNLSVNIKAASPSEFTGDMSHFGVASFRDRVKKIKIADSNKDRRLRISTAFKNARVEFSERNVSGSRKGAYYFS